MTCTREIDQSQNRDCFCLHGNHGKCSNKEHEPHTFLLHVYQCSWNEEHKSILGHKNVSTTRKSRRSFAHRSDCISAPFVLPTSWHTSLSFSQQAHQRHLRHHCIKELIWNDKKSVQLFKHCCWQDRSRYLMFYAQATTKDHIGVKQNVLLPQVKFWFTVYNTFHC